jgi:sterol desaturase/sphingolipid hydroxylase (fatty acid hydroxylase superfamily)
METVLNLLIPIVFAVMLVVERSFPAKKLPKVRFWLLKGIVFFVITGVAAAVLPAAIAAVLGERKLFDGAWLGTAGGAVVGFLVADFVGYWVHRTMHHFQRVWRWSHQMHHSAERMDLAGMTYQHPFEILLAFGLPGIATHLLGLSPAAGAIAGFLGFATAVFQHTNVRTPRFVGWFLMRPEAHALHHARGVHAYNYASVPLWDVVFGTYQNPIGFPDQYGFWDGASARLGAMLIGRDVGRSP